jgi:hypothetical protein
VRGTIVRAFVTAHFCGAPGPIWITGNNVGAALTRTEGTSEMPQFIISYRTAKSYAATVGSDEFADWATFLNDYIEPNVADPGYAVREPSRVLGEAGQPTQVCGYSIVTADDFEAALSVAEHCPTLKQGGAVEVAVLAPLPPEHPLERMRAKLSKP